jgi:hypothetical protein
LAVRWQRYLHHRQMSFADAYCGTAHAGRVSLDLIRRWTHDLPKANTLEIGLHPGMAPAAPRADLVADGWHDPLEALRARELVLLHSPRLLDLLAAVPLRLGRIASLSRRSLNGCRRGAA